MRGSQERPANWDVTRDRFDVRTADALLINLLGAPRVSIGTMVELGWADAYRIPVVTVMDPDDKLNPHAHDFVRILSGTVVDTLDKAIDIITEMGRGR